MLCPPHLGAVGNGQGGHFFVHCSECLWFVVRLAIESNKFSLCIGLFYGGYGAIMIPSFGIAEAFGGYTPMYYNSLGFFVLCEYPFSGKERNMI